MSKIWKLSKMEIDGFRMALNTREAAVALVEQAMRYYATATANEQQLWNEILSRLDLDRADGPFSLTEDGLAVTQIPGTAKVLRIKSLHMEKEAAVSPRKKAGRKR